MEAPEIIKQTWQQLFVRLTDRFTAQGYQLVHQEHNDPVFGSCWAMWSNNEDALRLTWDGKENWFNLEEAMLPISAVTPWQEIFIAPFDADKHDPVHASAIVQDVLNSLD